MGLAVAALILRDGVEVAPGVVRSGVPWMNYNTLAFTLTTGLALIPLLWHARAARGRELVLVSVVVATLVAATAATGTRAALVGIILLATWSLAYRIAPRLGLAAMGASATVVALAILTGRGPSLLLGLEGSRSDGDLSGRTSLWKEARAWWAEAPWIGNGAGSFAREQGEGLAAHNVILDLGAGVGLVGVALFCWLLCAALAGGTRGMPTRLRILIVGAWLAASAPLALSGVWLPQPAAWIALALVSSASVLADAPEPVAPWARDIVSRRPVRKLAWPTDRPSTADRSPAL